MACNPPRGFLPLQTNERLVIMGCCSWSESWPEGFHWIRRCYWGQKMGRFGACVGIWWSRLAVLAKLVDFGWLTTLGWRSFVLLPTLSFLRTGGVLFPYSSGRARHSRQMAGNPHCSSIQINNDSCSVFNSWINNDEGGFGRLDASMVLHTIHRHCFHQPFYAMGLISLCLGLSKTNSQLSCDWGLLRGSDNRMTSLTTRNTMRLLVAVGVSLWQVLVTRGTPSS